MSEKIINKSFFLVKISQVQNIIFSVFFRRILKKLFYWENFSAGGLNGPFEACEDEVSSDDLHCDVDQKARVFPYSSCRDLAVNDELPTKDEMKNKNPCNGAMVN